MLPRMAPISGSIMGFPEKRDAYASLEIKEFAREIRRIAPRSTGNVPQRELAAFFKEGTRRGKSISCI